MRIGILLDSLDENCQTLIWKGAAKQAQQLDIELIIFVGEIQLQFHGIDMHYEVLKDFIKDSRLDGLIVLGGSLVVSLPLRRLQILLDDFQPLPIVSVSHNIGHYPSIGIDNYRSMRLLIEHLIDHHNHQKLAFIKGPKYHEEAEQRFKAFSDVLKERSIPLDPDYVYDGGYFTETVGRNGVSAFWDDRNIKPDVIVAVDDNIAIGAIEELKSRGLSVPEDVCVTGFDDISTAALNDPPLTTVSQPLISLGEAALDLLLKKIEGAEVHSVDFPTYPVFRSSCGCLPNAHKIEKEQVNLADQIRKLRSEENSREKVLRRFYAVTQILLATYEPAQLMEVIYQALPKLGISDCFIVLFDSKSDIGNSQGRYIPERSSLELGYVDGQRILDAPIPFKTHDFMPSDVLSKKGAGQYAFMPLSFKADHYGYVLFHMDENNPLILFELFRVQISNAVRNSILLTRLEEEKRQKADFLVNFSHEVKTPLTIITNTLNAYESRLNGAPLPKELNLLKSSVYGMVRDVANILDGERLERGILTLSEGVINNISRLLTKKVRLFQPVAKNLNIQLNSNIEENVCVSMDRYAFDRIINNLIDNSLKYNKPGGKVDVSLTAHAERAELIIRDTGVGIPEEDQAHIFLPFFQLSHHKRNDQGIGMGLNIVRQMVEASGGMIELNSAPDHGTCFTIRFPLAGESAVSAEESGESLPYYEPANLLEPVFDEERFTVFIVEDNPHMIKLLQAAMEEQYNVYFAFNGQEALDRLKDIPKPDIIISDIMMDTMDGYDLLKSLVEEGEYNSIPFLFLSARTVGNEKIRALSMGAVDFIAKPFEMNELLAKISSMLKFRDNYEDHLLADFQARVVQTLKHGRKGDQLGRRLRTQYHLTSREVLVIKMIKNNHLHKEIALELGLSEQTVKNLAHQIYKKMGVSSKGELQALLSSDQWNPKI